MGWTSHLGKTFLRKQNKNAKNVIVTKFITLWYAVYYRTSKWNRKKKQNEQTEHSIYMNSY